MFLKKRKYNLTSMKRVLYRSLVEDKRIIFDDLSLIKPEERAPKSHILQIYDRNDNIGNFLPVLGIRKMLGFSPDTWDIHDRQIDFDFINQNYRGVIIGGAGLLCPPFKYFWAKFLEQCQLPCVIWGVGSGLGAGIGEKISRENLDADSQEYAQIVAQISQKCSLVNVRDNLTAEYFQMHNAHISACPTIVYMQDYRQNLALQSDTVLYSSHHFDSKSEIKKIKQDIGEIYSNFLFTANVQHPYIGLTDIIKTYYLKSSLVITTRLHGAIMAYGLGIPYIGITRGEKIRSFCQEYGNGILVEDINELKSTLKNTPAEHIAMGQIQLQPVLDFGEQAARWASSLTAAVNV